MSEWGSAPPAYIQVANDLRRKIESGEIPPGGSIPPITKLIEDYGVSNTTAQTAIRILKSAGLVVSERGKRTYVRTVDRVTSRSADYTSPPPDGETFYSAKTTKLEISEVEPPDDVAQALGIEDGVRVIRRSRVMVTAAVAAADGRPAAAARAVEIVSSYFPVEIARGTPLDKPRMLAGGTLAELRRLGLTPRHPATEWVEARMPTADESRTLDLPPGTPVLRLLRLTCTDDERPIEVLDMVFGGHRYRLEYELPVQE
jgi:GntR family transcriptional regulator